MRMHHLAIIAVITTLLVEIRCDFIDPGECLAAGQMFGPCINHECDDGLFCFAAKDGEMCVPPSTHEIADDWHVNECASWRGALGCHLDLGFCFISCGDEETALECEGGTVCDLYTEICVYPY